MKNAESRGNAETAVAMLVFVLGAIALFLTSPHNGDFWWSDAPRHALNGVFVKDLILAMPHDPKTWAMQYYVRYPALTILFYPPLFYFIEAPFYALFGVSHATAMAVVMLHYFALAAGLYLLARQWLDAVPAIAVGLAAMATPGFALWGRQVMLDIPELAFVTWSMFAMSRYLARGRPWLLYASIFLMLCAVYSKINAVLLFPALALALLSEKNLSAFRDRHVWFAAVFACVGMIPAVILTLKFGTVNIQSATDFHLADTGPTTFDKWSWYAAHLPEITGWPFLIAALATPALLLRRYRPANLPVADAVLLAGWFAFGYVFLSLIDLKEPRHGLLLVPPLLIAAGIAVSAIFASRIWAGAIMIALVIAAAAETAIAYPVPWVAGDRQAAAWIVEHAPPSAVVGFSGKRDGNFVWSMRTFENRRDITTLRLTKLLVQVAVERRRGITENPLTESQIAAKLDADGVSYVVAEDDYWIDIPVMARLNAVLHSPHFREVAVIPVTTNIPADEKTLRIYRNQGHVNPKPGSIDLDLPIIGSHVSGTLKPSGP